MDDIKTMLLPDYAPDQVGIGVPTSGTMSGCVPRADGYGPFKSLVEFSQALPANCRGYFFARKSDGSIAAFAGTSTDLYLLNNTTFVWDRVSKGGVSYAALVATDNWRFGQFNDLVIAVQANTVPQKYTLSGGGNFADLGGSPPQASHIAIINRFVVLTGLLASARRIQWCDLDGPETWTAGVGFADFQDLPDGGTVHGICGGDVYGAVFQDESIRSLTYAPGSAVTFQITRISTQDTLYAQYSTVEVNGRIFFISAQGIKVIDPGGYPRPIGKERVDRYFFDNVDAGNLQLVQGVADPQATRVYFSFKSKQGDAGKFDTVLCFDWGISQDGKWTVLPLSGQYLASLARPGLTLEALDAIAPGKLTITNAANNGSGLIRLTLNQLSNAFFDIHGQNFIVVYGVTGTVEANGTWKFTIIDATHIDLTGSAFVNAYTGGGNIGGSLDALGFSLDSFSTASQSALSAFSSNSKASFFTGANIEAIMETSEADLEGSVVFIDKLRALTDSPDVLISVGGRMLAKDAVAYTGETTLDDEGCCGVLLETRYARGRMRIPAGKVWTYARGVQPVGNLAGER